MKRYKINIILFALIGVFVSVNTLEAYWIWTPESKKFTNPKYAVKDSPKEQFDWAMSFYDAKNYQRAATEFEKLAKQYEFSEYASKSQYHVGLCYENMQKYYMAFENYQKAIDNFPHIANTEEIIAREFVIGNIYMEKKNPKVLGNDIMAPLDRAVEIFKKVVENAPYGKYAQEAQFNLGIALKKSERFEEAVQAFHKIIDDYPNSKLIAKAMFEEADCAYKASLKPAYDATSTSGAIKTFEKFIDKNKDADLTKKADSTMKRLKDNVAEKSFRTAEFYESQGKDEAAIIYYQDVISTYSDSSFVEKARAKIEQLKNKKDKKALPPLIFSSKKPEKKKVEVKKPVEAKKAPEAPVVGAPPAEVKKEEVSRQKAWKPLNFDNKNGEKKEPIVKETPPKKLWKPLIFGTKKEPKETVAKETLFQNNTWKPLSFGKKDPWRPLNFDTKAVE